MRMKSPALKSCSSEESEASDSTGEQSLFVVRQQKMQQGLLAKAAVYANNATKTTSTISQFNRILTAKRDPIVWGDASDRYAGRKMSEINNNDNKQRGYESSRKSTENGEDILSQRRIVTSEFSRLEISNHSMGQATEFNSLDFQDSFLNQANVCFNRSASIAPEVDLSSLPLDNVDTNRSCTSADDQDRYQSVLSFNTTQQLRSGFFRSIKRQYSPILTPKTHNTPENDRKFVTESVNTDSTEKDTFENEEATEEYAMSKFAKQKLEQLRKRGLKKIDVPTGLQWIRLELHEMREQDKSLFLQLIKLHSTIKDLRADMSGAEDFDSYDDLHSAASLWWPRRGHSFNTLPDFSSSDGAQLLRGGKSKTPLRRGFSLNYPPISSPPRYSPVTPLRENSRPSSGNDSEKSLNMMGVSAT